MNYFMETLKSLESKKPCVWVFWTIANENIA